MDEDPLPPLWKEIAKSYAFMAGAFTIFWIAVAFLKYPPVDTWSLTLFSVIGYLALFVFNIAGIPIFLLHRKVSRRNLAYRSRPIPTATGLAKTQKSKVRLRTALGIALLFLIAVVVPENSSDAPKKWWHAPFMVGAMLSAFTIFMGTRCEACLLPIAKDGYDPDRKKGFGHMKDVLKYATSKSCPRCGLERH